MDWIAVAARFAEQVEAPLLVLDRGGRIRLFNAAIERLTGWRRDEVLARPIQEVLVPAGHQAAATFFLREALRGTMDRFDGVWRERAGTLLRVNLSVTRVGEGRMAARILQVLAAQPCVDDAPPATPDEEVYEIATAGEATGMVLRKWAGGPQIATGVRCFDAYGLSAPCAGCPALARGPAAVDMAVVRTAEPVGSFRIVVIGQRSGDRATVISRLFPGYLFQQLIEMRVHELAERCQLSQREREVLDRLLLGYLTEQIASELAIAPRTVKYHQANILLKLGVESRLDLLRLLLP